MRKTSIRTEQSNMEFAERAAGWFTKNPDGTTYGNFEPGGLIAVRWGLMDRSVLVLKISDLFEPTVYEDLIKE